MASKSGLQASARDRGLNQSSISSSKTTKSRSKKPTDYTSHGVTDNDIFMLPSSDFQLLGFLTVIAALVRLFRIYQPSSVVFDEVQ